MDKDEEVGLRAFSLTVGCHAAASYPGQPMWVERDGARTDVSEIVAQWREEERYGYRVQLADDTNLLLYYIPEIDLWSGIIQR